jgi:hypothetical protein
MASVGAPDPRHNAEGTTDFRIARQLRSYAKRDAPPSRVKPIPVQVVHHASRLAIHHGHIESLAVTQMIIIGFFFLMRPGEHTAPTGENSPFRLQDIQFFVGAQRYSAATMPVNCLDTANFVTFEFTDQKNSVRGEVIGLGRSGDAHVCPVAATAERVRHLREHNAPPDTPLCTYYHDNQSSYVTSKDLTTTLRLSVSALGAANLGFLESDVSACSLRASGAMALLCAHVDTDSIRLLGRWRSDEMLRYLHVQAQPLMQNFSRLMLQGGNYTLLPNHNVPHNNGPFVPQGP